MPEKKRAPHQSGRGKGNVSQIQGHLCDKTADELLTELEARMDEMTDLTYDEDVIDSYLAALDKKAPLEKDFDVERSWEKFRSQHAILFDEDILPKPEVPQRGSHGFRFRRAFARVVVVAAIVAVFTMFCAQSILNLMYSYRMDGTFSSSIFEKDGSSVIEYTKNGIVHYIMSNVNVRVAAWVNGTCECSITGPLTEQEMITIIDSIYT